MQTKRMYAHDYTRPGFYMVTLVTHARQPLFGQCRDNCVRLSHMGHIVQRRWHEIPSHRPAIEASTLVIMPDHLHGILFVKEKLAKPLGTTLRGFTSGVTSELRKVTENPSFTVWEDNFHDRVIMNSKMLRAERNYIHDNPRRYCLKKAHPNLFVRVNRLKHPRTPSDVQWAGFGNLFLLDKPELIPVQVSRHATVTEVDILKKKVAEQIEDGAVMISPFISPGEKEIAACVMAQKSGALILLKPDGFPPLYKPSGTYFDLCAQGRLLVLSAYAYTGRRHSLTRESCLQMNKWVKTIACRKISAGFRQ